MLSRPANCFHRRNPRANEIAHGFMLGVRHPDRRQLAGSQQTGQYHRIAAVGLDLVARPRRSHRRCHDVAGITQLGQLPVQTIAGWASLICEGQHAMSGGQCLDQLRDRLWLARDRSVKPHLAAAAVLRNRNRYRLLAYIQTNECGISFHGSSPVSEALVATLTLDADMFEASHPTQLRTWRLTGRKCSAIDDHIHIKLQDVMVSALNVTGVLQGFAV